MRYLPVFRTKSWKKGCLLIVAKIYPQDESQDKPDNISKKLSKINLPNQSSHSKFLPFHKLGPKNNFRCQIYYKSGSLLAHVLQSKSGSLIHSSRYLISRSSVQVPLTSVQVPQFRYLSLVTSNQVPLFRYLNLGTSVKVPQFRYLCLGTSIQVRLSRYLNSGTSVQVLQWQ